MENLYTKLNKNLNYFNSGFEVKLNEDTIFVQVPTLNNVGIITKGGICDDNYHIHCCISNGEDSEREIFVESVSSKEVESIIILLLNGSFVFR